MVCKNNKSTMIFLKVFVLCSLFFFSCQTTPKFFDSFTEDANTIPLDTGAQVYIFANAKEARPILELLPIEELNNKHAIQILDRTAFVMAALFPQNSERRMQIAAWGNYPSSRAGMAFTFSRSWKKHRSQTGNSFWYSRANALSLALNSRQAFVVQTRINDSLNDQLIDPFAVPPGKQTPEGFNSFRQGAVLSCWLENPAPLLSRALNQAGIPIRFPVQQLFINLNTVASGQSQQYAAVFRLQFENASQARGMSAILNLAGDFSADDTISSLFLANPPVLNDRNIDIKTAPLTEKELSLLLEMFLF